MYTMHRCSPLMFCLLFNRLKWWTLIVYCVTVDRWLVQSAPNDEILQGLARTTSRVLDLSSYARSLNDDSNEPRAVGTISFIAFASAMLLAAILCLALSHLPCRQLHCVKTNESEWYMEDAAIVSRNNNNNETINTRLKNDRSHSSSTSTENPHNTSVDSTDGSDEVIDFDDNDDVEANISEPVISLQELFSSNTEALIRDIPWQWCNDTISSSDDDPSDDDDGDNDHYDPLQGSFNGKWNQDEDDGDHDIESNNERQQTGPIDLDSGKQQQIGPIDLDSGKVIPIVEELPPGTTSKTSTLRQEGNKRQQRNLLSPTTKYISAVVVHKKRKTVRRATAKTTRDEYFQEKQMVRAYRIGLLQPIPEMTEHDATSTISILSSRSVCETNSKPDDTIKTSAPSTITMKAGGSCSASQYSNTCSTASTSSIRDFKSQPQQQQQQQQVV